MPKSRPESSEGNTGVFKFFNWFRSFNTVFNPNSYSPHGITKGEDPNLTTITSTYVSREDFKGEDPKLITNTSTRAPHETNKEISLGKYDEFLETFKVKIPVDEFISFVKSYNEYKPSRGKIKCILVGAPKKIRDQDVSNFSSDEAILEIAEARREYVKTEENSDSYEYKYNVFRVKKYPTIKVNAFITRAIFFDALKRQLFYHENVNSIDKKEIKKDDEFEYVLYYGMNVYRIAYFLKEHFCDISSPKMKYKNCPVEEILKKLEYPKKRRNKFIIG